MLRYALRYERLANLKETTLSRGVYGFHFVYEDSDDYNVLTIRATPLPLNIQRLLLLAQIDTQSLFHRLPRCVFEYLMEFIEFDAQAEWDSVPKSEVHTLREQTGKNFLNAVKVLLYCGNLVDAVLSLSP
jgi:hypothetical protein